MPLYARFRYLASQRRVALVVCVLLAACGAAPTELPNRIVVVPVASSTPLATSTPGLTSPPALTETAPAAAVTVTPTNLQLRTKTPGPTGSPTLTPTATRRRGGGGSAAASATATAGAPANGGSLDTRAHGVTGTLRTEATERVFKVNEPIWFRWTVTNLATTPLDYGYIGVLIAPGEFHTSWSTSFLDARRTAAWRDWVSAPTPGEYTLVLTICLSPAAECQGGGNWVDLTAPLSVAVVP